MRGAIFKREEGFNILFKNIRKANVIEDLGLV
jgi:hypothetical protein